MKKSDELRRRTRKLLAKNLIVLVALALVAIVGAYSWFTQTTTEQATGISASTKVNDALEFFIAEPKDQIVNNTKVSVDQYSQINSWISTYNTNHPNDQKAWHIGSFDFDLTDPDLDAELGFLDDLYITEVTGDGITFKVPKLRQMEDVAYVDTSLNFTDAVVNENYLSFDLYFRSKREYTVSLLADSKIEPLSEIEDRDDEVDMKNGAIGAVRMSVLDIGSTGARELLWIPGPGVWYDGLTRNTTTNELGVLHLSSDNDWNNLTNRGHSVTYNGTAAVYSPMLEDTDDHVYYSDAGGTKTRVKMSAGSNNVVASTDYDYELGEDKPVVTLSKTSGEYYYGYIRVNLWIEGEDAEARVKFVNGKFNMSLDFDIVESN